METPVPQSNLEEIEVSKKNKDIRVRTIGPYKLKDKNGRFFIAIHLKKHFGFTPEAFIIEKVQGSHDKILVRAILTDAEIIKEDKKLKSLEEKKNGKPKSTSPEEGSKTNDLPGSVESHS